MKRNKNTIFILWILLITVCIITLTVGYSVFHASLDVNSVSAIIRAQADVRITGVSVASYTSNATSNYEDFSVSKIYSSVDLDNADSTITYQINVTNVGNVMEGIYAIDEIYKVIDSSTGIITNNNSNLEIKNKTVSLKEALCDSNNSSQCTLGSVTTFNITIGYADNGYDGVNTKHSIELGFDFRRVFNVSYVGFSSTVGLPNQMIYGDTLDVAFTSTTGIPYDVSVVGATGSYNSNNNVMTLSNVTITSVDESIIVTRMYSVTYSNFTGDTSGLISRITANGGTITFTNTSGIPSSVNVTGASSNYVSPILTLSNVTGNVTITFTSSGSGNTQVIDNGDGTTTTVTENVVDNGDGTETTTIVSVNHDANGNVTSSSQTTSTTGSNQEGGTTTNSTTINYDANGNVTTTSETETVANSNGSSSSTTTNYNANGDPVSGSSNTVDTSGNSNTQEVEYDANGNTTVTAYTIDTSANSNGGEIIDDSIETGFIPFDGGSDWELNMTFVYDSSDNGSTDGAKTVAILGCSDWTGGTFNGGFTFRFYNYKNTGSSTATSTYKYRGMLKYRTQLQIENSTGTGSTLAYIINTNNSGAIMTSPMTYTLFISKIGSQMTFRISPNSELTYNPTRNENTTEKGLTTAAAGTTFTKTWIAQDNSASTDITIGGYMSANGTISQKANIEVLDFSVRKLTNS